MDLGIFPAVSKTFAALAYFLARHEHYKHLSLCEHGLSSTKTSFAAITSGVCIDYICYYIILLL